MLARLGLLDKTVDKIATDNSRYVPFTQLSNLTGTPSMSVPLHWTADGLPLGVQFMGPFVSEDRLLQVARQLEEAQPWFDRMAPLASSMDMRGVVIALHDFSLALSPFVSQNRLVVRAILPLDGDLVAVMTGIARSDFCFIDFVAARFVQLLCIPHVAFCNQGVFAALVVARVLSLHFRDVPVVGNVTLFHPNHGVITMNLTAILFDFARVVANCRVVRFDFSDGGVLCEGAGTDDRQQTCDEQHGGFSWIVLLELAAMPGWIA